MKDMKRKIRLLIVLFLMTGCAGNNLEINSPEYISLENGKKIEVKISERETQENTKTLLVEYRTDKKNVSERKLEKEISEIWSKVKSKAEEKEIEEGVIKFEFPAEPDGHDHEQIYEIKLFSAEKIENGTWKIKKVN